MLDYSFVNQKKKSLPTFYKRLYHLVVFKLLIHFYDEYTLEFFFAYLTINIFKNTKNTRNEYCILVF